MNYNLRLILEAVRIWCTSEPTACHTGHHFDREVTVNLQGFKNLLYPPREETPLALSDRLKASLPKPFRGLPSGNWHF
jgi:hypothetical protein